MDEKLETLLTSLDEEIERKCFELKQKKAEKTLKQLFIFCCLLFVTLPFWLMWAGINVITLAAPVFAFLGISVIALIPFALSNSSGGVAQ